jgi:hypothetical protein
MAKKLETRHLGHTKNDSDLYKAFPASFAALIAALRQNWGAISGDLPAGTVQSAQEFTDTPPQSFLDAVAATAKKFKGLELEELARPAAAIRKLETGGGTERTQKKDRARLHYWHLRVLSDWVGLSVSQLVMATHFISVERRAENAGEDRLSELRRLHQQYTRVLDEIATLIAEGEASSRQVFYAVLENEEHKYHPREEVILRLVNAAGRKQRKAQR